jgi:hypothetical protein
MRSSLEEFLLPLLLLHAMWLTYCIDIVLWTTICLVIDWCCSLCTNCLFYIIERIKTPHIIIERTITVMFCFFTVPISIMNLLLHILPSFHNYKRINSTRTGKNCSSGQSGRKGRHGDRHHTWWCSLNSRKRKSSIVKHQHNSP